MTSDELREKAIAADRKEAFESTRQALRDELTDLASALKHCDADQMRNIADSLDAIADVLRDKVRFGLME